MEHKADKVRYQNTHSRPLTSLCSTYYTDSACLRSKQDEVCAALDSLQKLRFRLPLYSSELDRSDYWTLKAKKMIDASGGTEGIFSIFIIKSDLRLTYLQNLYSRYRGYRKPNGLGEQGKGKRRIGE